jgi:SAM-dependent methyltransferase
VTLLRATGEGIPPNAGLDAIFSIGVRHHIPDPRPVVREAYEALRPGGLCFVWLYGREGNELL